MPSEEKIKALEEELQKALKKKNEAEEEVFQAAQAVRMAYFERQLEEVDSRLNRLEESMADAEYLLSEKDEFRGRI